jgi:hypothetical protein
MALPYRDGAFRAATMAFGGRNVPDLEGTSGRWRAYCSPAAALSSWS